MDSFENRSEHIGYEEALNLTLKNITPLSDELCPTMQAIGRVASIPVKASVNLPSADSSLKDGYAVVSSDIDNASPSMSVSLRLIGISNAGEESNIKLVPGTAIRVLSGASIPRGADAVLAEEFAICDGARIRAFADAGVGRNILEKGADIKFGDQLITGGELVTPAKVGLLIAGGVFNIRVARTPKVALLATGDEVVLPGRPMTRGKLYASNIALQQAWLNSLGISCITEISGDSFGQLTRLIDEMISESDVLITSGGAWTGDRDLVVKAFKSLNWTPVFHRVRMGPGKAVGMGLLHNKPVFCLPGGPPSNEMAFLMITLPGISRMLGREKSLLPILFGVLAEEVSGQKEWTQFVHCDLTSVNGEFHLKPFDVATRLSAMTYSKAIIKIPEGVRKLEADTRVPFYCTDMYSC
ncbi:MAG: molybdopterin molybdotransferase MoeA [Desulfomonilaceae bacterium]